MTKGFYGFKAYIRGVRWLLAHKRYLLLSFVPTFFGLLALVTGWGFFLGYVNEVVTFFIFERPEEWYWLAGYWLLYGLTFLAVMGGVLMTCLLLINVVASPIYDLVSTAVEKDLLGHSAGISTWQSFKLMGEELKKVFFVLVLSALVVLVTFWIPVLNAVSVVVAAFLVGWEFYDFSLARRGWRFRERLSFVLKDVWAVTCFGLWMLVPFAQFFLMPLAAAGGTYLAIEGLKEYRPDLISSKSSEAMAGAK